MKNLLEVSNVLFPDEMTTKEACLTFIANHAGKAGIASEQEQVLTDLKEREKACTTGLLDGFAIPHCKSSAILDSKIIIVKSASPIEWETMDGQPVHFVICFLLSEQAYKDSQLTLLSTISRKLINEAIKSRLMQTDQAQEVIDILVGGE